jgi:diguanylate cyclase (GGDEF)-like protein
MTPEAMTVLIVAADADLEAELTREDGFAIRRAARIEAVTPDGSVDAVVIELDAAGPRETLETLRAMMPGAAVLVVTDPARQADGSVAIHAGAEDHLVRGAIPAGLLPRAVRYAVARRRLSRELATTDETTGLLNLRGFIPIVERHLRMADRASTPAVFLFVRVEGLVEAAAEHGDTERDAIGRDAAGVVLEAVRGSDVPARIAPDTFCILLSGGAQGAETLVLSRLVEAIAVHNARRDRPRPLSLSVGSAVYDPEDPDPLERILQTAGRRLDEQRTSSEAP